ncbi:MAG TPA: DUF308 domain-containing protein [Pseudacidobacterium sp.]|jgi:uncharacterized membrane protein HdeD (DUF308 family)|nr:DUF308 domain-containing protein [Pseudacidobacterium sp.]
MSADTVSNTLKRGTTRGIIWAVFLIICGIAALALPVIAGISTAIVLSILIIIAGIVHLVTAVVAGSFGGYLWRTLVGIVYIIGGIWLFRHPVLALHSFTLVLGFVFVMEGVFDIFAFFQVRKMGGAGWLLFDGIITLLLAFLILDRWPSSSAWAIATIVGINLLITGFTRLMALSAARSALSAAT